MTFPSPRTQPLVGHLGRWGIDPLALLDEGAALGSVFTLRLWRKVIVGFSPQWNRFLLTDLDTFRSRGSLSGLSPYLAGGVVRSDLPRHKAQRAHLNPGFRRGSVATLSPVIDAVVRRNLPMGQFDAAEWTADVTRQLLNATFFGGHFPDNLLADFLTPLDSEPPGPFVPRPRLFRQMNQALKVALLHADDGTLAPTFAAMNDGIEQARVAIGAAYDTTAHTMAWLLWHLGDPSKSPDSVSTAHLVSETLRLYPSGWLGSRIASRDVEFDGMRIDAGTLLFYSPYLTHRYPSLWSDPLTFRAERFDQPMPAWGYLPFSAGQRTCLGAGLATLILRSVADILIGRLERVGDPPILRAGLTLAPASAIMLRRTVKHVILPAPTSESPTRKEPSCLTSSRSSTPSSSTTRMVIQSKRRTSPASTPN